MKAELHSLLNKVSFTEAEARMVADAVQAHPYSGFLHALHARVLHITDDGNKEQALTQAAIRSADRVALQAYVFAKASTAPRADKAEPQPTETTAVAEPATYQEKEESLAPPAEEKLFEEQYLAETLASGYILQDIEKAPAAKQEETVHPPESINQQESRQKETEKAKGPEEAEPAPKEPVKPTAGPLRERMSFSAWLETLGSQEAAIQPKGPEPALPRKDTLSIIEHFIKNEEQIVPKRQEFFNPSKAARQSLQDQDNFVTETLANIYAAQGNVQKAISTYEKLSLKHPEKSSYFAARIDELKKNLK